MPEVELADYAGHVTDGCSRYCQSCYRRDLYRYILRAYPEEQPTREELVAAAVMFHQDYSLAHPALAHAKAKRLRRYLR